MVFREAPRQNDLLLVTVASGLGCCVACNARQIESFVREMWCSEGPLVG